MNDDFQNNPENYEDQLKERLENQSKEERIRTLESEINNASDRTTKNYLQDLLDSEKGSSKKKPLILVAGLLILVIIGLVFIFLIRPNLNDTPAPTGSSSSSTAQTASSSSNSEVLESSSVAESNEPIDPADIPYAVPVSELSNRTFTYTSSVNTPNSVIIAFENESTGTAEFLFERPDGTSDVTIFSVTYKTIPTADKRVFIDGSVENLKNVMVNTEIVFGDVIRDDFDRAEDYSSYDSMYVFYNGDGVSLLTPNYAGNVPSEGDTDIMIELRG